MVCACFGLASILDGFVEVYDELTTAGDTQMETHAPLQKRCKEGQSCRVCGVSTHAAGVNAHSSSSHAS